jgi:integrase
VSDPRLDTGNVSAPDGSGGTTELRSKHFDPQRRVVVRRVREGYDGPDSVFADDYWDLLPGVSQESISDSSVQIDFMKAFADPIWRLTAKEFLMASLTYRIPGQGRWTPIKYTNVGRELQSFRRFVKFITAAGAQRLSMVTDDMLAAYVLLLTSEGTTSTYQGGQLRTVKKLWAYRQYIIYDRFSSEPWPGRTGADLAGGHKASGENTTPRIPEEVMGPTLRAAMRYIDDFSDEILEKVVSLRRLYETERVWPTSQDRSKKGDRNRPDSDRSRLAQWIEQLRENGRGVPRLPPGGVLTRMLKTPGRDTDPFYLSNRRRVALEAGLSDGTSAFNNKPVLQTMIRDAVEELGWDHPGKTDRPSVFRILDSDGGRTTPEVYRHLLTACYIVIAYLSGMRDGEVLSLRVGCCYMKLTRDGLRTRYMVRGRVYKGRGVDGDEGDWVVNEPVVRAVRVLERIAEIEKRGEPGSPLFRILAHNRGGKQVHIKAGMMNGYLNRFRDHANRLASLGSDAVEYPPIPTYNEKVWHFQTRMFRRTLAWYIANRPFGIVAGAIQFQHVGISTFEGYAGTSASGFPKELEAERILKKTADLIDSFERARRGEVFAGAGGERVRTEMLQIAEVIGAFPGQVVDEARLRALLLHHFRTLVPGVFNDCAFSPGPALCLLGVPEDKRAAPLVTLCDPVNCTNSAITKRHLVLYQLAYDNADAALKTRGITPNQTKIIRRERDRYGRIRDELLAS